MRFICKNNLISLLLGLIMQSYGAYAFEPLFIDSVTRSFDKTILDNFAGQLGSIEGDGKSTKLFMLVPQELVSASVAQGQDVDRTKKFKELPVTQRYVAMYIKMLQAYLANLPANSLPSYMDFISFIGQLKTMQNSNPLKLEKTLFKNLSLQSKNYVRVLFKDRPEKSEVNQYNIRFLLERITSLQKDCKNSNARKQLKAKLLQSKQENVSLAEKPKRKLVRKAQQSVSSIKENIENCSENLLEFTGEE